MVEGRSPERPLGVGIVGAGRVVQAIHLPTLAALGDSYVVRHVMDVVGPIATSVASRVGARASTTVEDLLADPDVDVVAVCSPPEFHAEQTVAALRAGKRAVLCEKPFATSQAEAAAIGEAAREASVPVIVGTMHVYEPEWPDLRAVWGDLVDRVHTVRSSIVLPFNERYEDWATEVLYRPSNPGGEPTPEALAALMDAAVMGLAVHDLPLVRQLLPDWASVAFESATVLQPFGYLVNGSAGSRTVQLAGAMHAHWKPAWELEAIGDDVSLAVEFTPSFVAAGSGSATLTLPDGSTRRFGPYQRNGYAEEWLALRAALSGDASAVPPVSEFLADIDFVLRVAELTRGIVLEGARR